MFRVTLTAVIFGMVAGGALLAQNENQIHDRGQTGIQDRSQTLNRGRAGRQNTSTMKPVTMTGTLVDAGCADRTQQNLKRPSDTEMAATPSNPAEEAKQRARQKTPRDTGSANRAESGAIDAKGVDVDKDTAERERADALEHQVPDLRTRQDDPSCAITGASHGFAFLMPNGRLLALDEGGNTLAEEAIQSSPKGSAMLNGSGPGVKPQVEVKGLVRGDRLIVSSLKIKK